MTYISDLCVLEGQNTNPPAGWTKISTDLNKGASGAYLYFAYATDSDRSHAVTDIQFYEGSEPTPEAGYQLIKTNLNKDVKDSKAIWAAFTRDPVAGAALTGLRVHADGDGGSTPQPPWFRIEQDLNAGAGRDTPYIRLLYTTA